MMDNVYRIYKRFKVIERVVVFANLFHLYIDEYRIANDTYGKYYRVNLYSSNKLVGYIDASVSIENLVSDNFNITLFSKLGTIKSVYNIINENFVYNVYEENKKLPIKGRYILKNQKNINEYHSSIYIDILNETENKMINFSNVGSNNLIIFKIKDEEHSEKVLFSLNNLQLKHIYKTKDGLEKVLLLVTFDFINDIYSININNQVINFQIPYIEDVLNESIDTKLGYVDLIQIFNNIKNYDEGAIYLMNNIQKSLDNYRISLFKSGLNLCFKSSNYLDILNVREMNLQLKLPSRRTK